MLSPSLASPWASGVSRARSVAKGRPDSTAALRRAATPMMAEARAALIAFCSPALRALASPRALSTASASSLVWSRCTVTVWSIVCSGVAHRCDLEPQGGEFLFLFRIAALPGGAGCRRRGAGRAAFQRLDLAAQFGDRRIGPAAGRAAGPLRRGGRGARAPACRGRRAGPRSRAWPPRRRRWRRRRHPGGPAGGRSPARAGRRLRAWPCHSARMSAGQ